MDDAVFDTAFVVTTSGAVGVLSDWVVNTVPQFTTAAIIGGVLRGFGYAEAIG